MSDIELQTEDYAGNADLAGQEAIDGQQATADSAYLTRSPCSNGDCQNTHNPAEDAWVKLVSAIPIAGQVQSFRCVATGTAAPSQEEVQSLVAQIRPADGDQYALRTIGDKWIEFNREFSANESTAVEPILRMKLGELANGWQGTDFDAFEEQMNVVFANCEQIANDIGSEATGMVGLLNQKSDEIYALQGGDSHELPYPAPQYWVEDEMSLFTDGRIHVRAPFTDGDCDIAEDCSFAGTGTTNEAMELGGFDSEYTDELNQYVVDQTEFHYTQLKAEQIGSVDTTGMNAEERAEATTLTPEQESSLRAQAERLAEQDANQRAAEDYDEGSQDYEARATEQNETVTARWQDAESATQEFTPTVEPSRDSTFRESAADLDNPSYSSPGGGDFNGLPNGSGTGGLDSPPPSGSFGSGGTGGGGTGGLDPWEGGSGDDEDPSGGLASGGGTGVMAPPGLGTGPGGGPVTGGGSSLGPGSGLFGPAVGGGTGGAGGGVGGSGRGGGAFGKGQGLFGKTAGAGSGTGAGQGTGGRGAGGRAGGGMIGGRPGGANGENEEGRETWLIEDEDVWGTARFNDPDDPLA